MTRKTKRIAATAVVCGAAAVGATAIATAGGENDDGTETAITGSALKGASDAALAHTGGGRVAETEAGDEESYYEVEVTNADGSQTTSSSIVASTSSARRPSAATTTTNTGVAATPLLGARSVDVLRALTLAFLFVAAAPAAAAPPLRFVDRGPASYELRTNGERLVLSDTGQASADVYDAITRRRGNIGAPPGCRFADISRDDELLWSCNDGSGVIQDFATAKRTMLPILTAPDVESPAYTGLGRRWLRVRRGGYHYAYVVHVNRATGQMNTARDDNRRQLFDLDAASLTRPFCRGMRRPLVPDDESGFRMEPGPLAISSGRAAATTYTGDQYSGTTVLLQRCGDRQRVLQRCDPPSFCSQPAINTRIVAWTRTRSPYTRLYVRTLAGGRTRSIRLPAGGASQPLVVGSHLFIGANRRLLEVLL